MLGPGMQVGSYVVESALGQGGMAAVHRVRHAKLGSTHAMKVLLPTYARDPAVRERFLTEGRIQAQLRHPGLVPVTDLVETEEVVGLVMEFVEGRSFEAMLAKGLPDVGVVIDVFRQILAAVGHVHAYGVVHRDLKPSNVMLDTGRDGTLRARILDFGIAKVDRPGEALTQEGLTVGTLRYMSPEQVRGEGVGPCSDLFSLGVMLYEALSGALPFSGDTQFQIQMAIVKGAYEPLDRRCPELPHELSGVVRRALSTAPEARFQTSDAFAEALREATGGPPARTSKPSVSALRPVAMVADDDLLDDPLIVPPRRSPWPWVIGLLVVAAVAGAFVLRPKKAPAGPSASELGAIVREAKRVDPKSGLEFVRLPGGEFRMGCEPQDTMCAKDEPKPKVVRVGGFWMGRTEVTVAAWEKCVAAGACVATPKTVVNAEGKGCNASEKSRREHPLNCVTWDEARAFCAFAGGRLPTAAEWEYAAKSGRSVLFPWGNDLPGDAHAQFLKKEHPTESTAKVGAHPEGATPWGLVDLAGNVWEWTSDPFDASSKDARGGSWKSKQQWLRASNRFAVETGARSDTVGFRCAADEDEG